ncbi:MAG: FMN-binding protein [Eubacteriales bacterium]|nr:FMN-binding protein [Eubacteriales bacterium]
MKNTNFFLRVICLVVIIAAVLFYNGHKQDEVQAEQAVQLSDRIDALEAQQKEMLEALQTYYEEREEEKESAEAEKKEAGSEEADKSDEAEGEEEAEDSSDNYYKDGVYTGEGTGFGGTIQVEVTLENDTLTNISVVSAPGEDSAYLSQAQGVISTVLSEQSTNVDTVSGATFSSTGILNAIDDALVKAENQ